MALILLYIIVKFNLLCYVLKKFYVLFYFVWSPV